MEKIEVMEKVVVWRKNRYDPMEVEKIYKDIDGIDSR